MGEGSSSDVTMETRVEDAGEDEALVHREELPMDPEPWREHS